LCEVSGPGVASAFGGLAAAESVTQITVAGSAPRDDGREMLAHKRFSLSVHGAIEFVGGMAMMLAPAVLHFTIAALVVSVLLGAIQAGMGLRLTTYPDRTIGWHGLFDAVLVLATAGAGLALAASGDGRAAIFLVALVAVQAFLSFATSYATVA
jgi:hypothetical protein